ncbi:MAG TPA: thioesterase family protein [Baekduia sp.]|nr:thioesterase family protein [Baekduia sp.]
MPHKIAAVTAYRRPITTRWADNDIYGHVNNVEYYAFFDTVINAFLIEHGGLDIHGGEAIGLCAESHCKFEAPVAFPDSVEAELHVQQLGSSSVRYGVELYAGEQRIAHGWFVHVFVDRQSRRPVPIPDGTRSALATLVKEDTDVA